MACFIPLYLLVTKRKINPVESQRLKNCKHINQNSNKLHYVRLYYICSCRAMDTAAYVSREIMKEALVCTLRHYYLLVVFLLYSTYYSLSLKFSVWVEMHDSQKKM